MKNIKKCSINTIIAAMLGVCLEFMPNTFVQAMDTGENIAALSERQKETTHQREFIRALNKYGDPSIVTAYWMGIKQEAGYDIDTVLEEEGQKRLESFGFSSVKEYTNIFYTVTYNKIIKKQNLNDIMYNLLGLAFDFDKSARREVPVEVVKYLLESGADPNYDDGHTPVLVWAVENHRFSASEENKAKIIELLIERGAHVNGYGVNYYSALTWAAMKGLPRIAQVLLNHGANVNHKSLKNGVSPLIVAVRCISDFSMITLLLNHGADINYENPLSGKSPLIYAIERNDISLVELLIKHGAEVNPTPSQIIPQADIDFVKDYTEEERKQELMDDDPDYKDEYTSHETVLPLEKAARIGNRLVIDLLASVNRVRHEK